MTLFSKILALALALSIGFISTMSANAQPKVERLPQQKIEDWFYRCEIITTNGKEGKTCWLAQDFVIEGTKDANGNTQKPLPLLALEVRKLKQKDKKITILAVRAPLGTNLMGGVMMRINGKEYQRSPFITCLPQPLGCRSSFVIEKDLKSGLENGSKIEISYIMATDKKTYPIELSTKGYAKGVKKLKF